MEDLLLGGGLVALPKDGRPPLPDDIVGDALQIWCAMSFLAKCRGVDSVVGWDDLVAVLKKKPKKAAKSPVLHNMHVFLVGIVYDDVFRNAKHLMTSGESYDGRVLNGYTWQELLRQYLQMLATERQAKGDIGDTLE